MRRRSLILLRERHALWGFSLLGAAVILLMMGGVGSAEDGEVTITGKEVVERLLWGFGMTFARMFTLGGLLATTQSSLRSSAAWVCYKGN